MTDFTPDIKIYTLPPNAPHTDPRVEVTDLVDYSITISRGTSEYISAPYPGHSILTLLFDENVIPDIELGTWVEIQAYKTTTATYEIIHAGYVTSRQSAYRAYGLSGFVLEWQFSLTSPISILQNTSWYNSTITTDVTDVLLLSLYAIAGRFIWSEINANTTWADYGPTQWEYVDFDRQNTFPFINSAGEFSTQTLTTGFRNVWDDLTIMTYGVYGYLYEQPNGDIEVKFPSAESVPMTSSLTVTQEMISPDIIGGDSFEALRNKITMTEFDGVQSTYYDDDSISLYNERSGSLTTYLDQTLEAANIAQLILNGLSYPFLSTQKISLNLLNPVFSDAERNLLLFSPLGKLITVEAPIPMGGTMEYLTIGCQIEATKDAFILGLTLAPYSQARNSQNWDQIPYNYTWSSYGVAFPTQEWQDL
jgi:hypothetical protein